MVPRKSRVEILVCRRRAISRNPSFDFFAISVVVTSHTIAFTAGTIEILLLFFSRQENPEHQVHLMTVAPFIVDTGMIQGSIIRFPGQ